MFKNVYFHGCITPVVSKSPNWGYSPSKWPTWLINGGYKLLINWDDPPSILPTYKKVSQSDEMRRDETSQMTRVFVVTQSDPGN